MCQTYDCYVVLVLLLQESSKQSKDHLNIFLQHLHNLVLLFNPDFDDSTIVDKVVVLESRQLFGL